MPPATEAGNWYPYGVPEILSLFPDGPSAKQQLPDWKSSMTFSPWLALYWATNASLCALMSAAVMSTQSPLGLRA
jgi:hypothetical protein